MATGIDAVQNRLHDHIRVDEREHASLSERLEKVEEAIPGIKEELVSINTTIRIAAWILGILIALVGAVEHFDKIAEVFKK